MVVEVGEGELRSLRGQFHRKAGSDAVGALPVHQSEALDISGCEHSADLRINPKPKEKSEQRSDLR